MLHIINSLPNSASFLNNARSGDTVIFTENAVLAAKQGYFDIESLTQKALDHINLYVRKADLLIQDISISELIRGVIVIDDMQYQSAITQNFAIKSYN
ncbi:MAG: hypothetical protein KAT04_07020 [Methylococcales bacterium]|nr:hypothetical protein [Methylococcales bacterium]